MHLTQGPAAHYSALRLFLRGGCLRVVVFEVVFIPASVNKHPKNTYIYLYIYIYIYSCICIYVERERERDMYVCVYIYIYMREQKPLDKGASKNTKSGAGEEFPRPFCRALMRSVLLLLLCHYYRYACCYRLLHNTITYSYMLLLYYCYTLLPIIA